MISVRAGGLALHVTSSFTKLAVPGAQNFAGQSAGVFSVFVNDFAIDDGVLYSFGFLDHAPAAAGEIGKHHNRPWHDPVVVEDGDVGRQAWHQAPSVTYSKIVRRFRSEALDCALQSYYLLLTRPCAEQMGTVSGVAQQSDMSSG